MKPIWYLDVDGVINACPGGNTEVWDDYIVTRVINHSSRMPTSGWRICYSPTVIEFINKVHDEGLAEVVWLTTWTHAAAEMLAPALGLRHFRHLARDFEAEAAPDQRAIWWKFPLLLADLATAGIDRPVIWTDDDITFDRSAVEWLQERSRDGYKVLGAVPNTEHGLTPRLLTTIADFLGSAKLFASPAMG